MFSGFIDDNENAGVGLDRQEATPMKNNEGSQMREPLARDAWQGRSQEGEGEIPPPPPKREKIVVEK